MAFRSWSRALFAAALLQLGISGCSTPDRLPAVPQSAAAQAVPDPGTSSLPIRYLVSRETDSFAAAANAANNGYYYGPRYGYYGGGPYAYYDDGPRYYRRGYHRYYDAW